MLHEILINLPGVSEAQEDIRSERNQWTAGCVFRLDRSRTGWKALEFLAWWAGDFSTRGALVQLVPVAKAPMEDDTIYFGETLQFSLRLGSAPTEPEAKAILRRAGTDFLTQLERFRHIVT